MGFSIKVLSVQVTAKIFFLSFNNLFIFYLKLEMSSLETIKRRRRAATSKNLRVVAWFSPCFDN